MAKTKESNQTEDQAAAAEEGAAAKQVQKGPHGGMHLVLVEDVTHLGKQGEVVEVKPGYARNYLLPNGLATIPSEHNLRLLERYKVRVEQAREARKSDLKSLAEQIAHEDHHHRGQRQRRRPPVRLGRRAGRSRKAMRGKNLLVEPDMVKLEGRSSCLGMWPAPNRAWATTSKRKSRSWSSRNQPGKEVTSS